MTSNSTGKGTAPSQNARPDLQQVVDQALAQLADGLAGFNVPTKQPLGTPFTVNLVLGEGLAPDHLLAQVRGPGERVLEHLKVGAIMSASLRTDPAESPSTFLIYSRKPETQARASGGTLAWEWDVTPRIQGSHALCLEVSVLLDLDGTKIPHPYPVMRRVLEIEAAPAKARWPWLLLLLCIPLGYGFHRLRRSRQHAGMQRLHQTGNGQVFVSYARKDEARILPLVEGLTALGFGVWVDQAGIDGASRWSQMIVEALRSSSVVLVFASRRSLASDFVIREILLATDEGKPLVPILLEDVEFPDAVRLQFAGVQHILHRRGQEDITLRALHQALARLGVLPVNESNPVKGTNRP